MKKTCLYSFFILIFSLSESSVYAGLCTAGAGSWEDPAIWSCGHVPTCGDVVVIPAGITVTITTQLDYTGMCGGSIEIDVFGTLNFQNGKKLTLNCGSVLFVQAGGSITGGGGGGSANLIDICSITAWTSGMGTVSGPASVSSGGVGGLPVELLYFSAKNISNSYILLNWATATETNNNSFKIESSSNGSDFKEITSVNAAGNGNSLITNYYNYKDANPVNGLSYYRLKQVDKNGSYKYYNIVTTTFTKKSFADVYPNPAYGNLTINVSEDYLNATIKLTNAIGEEVINNTLSSYTNSIDVSVLQSGFYFVTIDNGTEISKTKIMVQK